MRVNAIMTWLALAATWVWIGVAYIDGRAARSVTDAMLDNPRVHFDTMSNTRSVRIEPNSWVQPACYVDGVVFVPRDDGSCVRDAR